MLLFDEDDNIAGMQTGVSMFCCDWWRCCSWIWPLSFGLLQSTCHVIWLSKIKKNCWNHISVDDALSHIIRHFRIIIRRIVFQDIRWFLYFFLHFLKIAKLSVKPKALPWREENDTYVITAYFKDPSLICSKKHSHARYIGDRLLIQNSSKSDGLVQVPLLEDGLLETVWTEGECFWSMGKCRRFFN